MSPVPTLEIELDADVAMSALARMASASMEPLLDDLGPVLVGSTRDRIRSTKTSPDGSPWKPWSPNYKRPAAGGILFLSGDLHDSIEGQVAGEELAVGTALPYGNVHQKTRPYLGLSDDDEKAVLDEAFNFIEAVLR